MVRRIVTGEGPDGSSRIVSDDQVGEGVVWFGTFGRYSELVDPADEASTKFGLDGPDAGYALRVFSLPPDSVTKPMYASGDVPLHDAEGFHRTTTVDLVIVLEGQVISQMDGGERVRLESGDCLIQRGTRHAWRNPGEVPAKLAAVMLNDRRPGAPGTQGGRPQGGSSGSARISVRRDGEVEPAAAFVAAGGRQSFGDGVPYSVVRCRAGARSRRRSPRVPRWSSWTRSRCRPSG